MIKKAHFAELHTQEVVWLFSGEKKPGLTTGLTQETESAFA